MNFPKISTPAAEGVLQVSKWLKFQILLDEEEMGSLLSHLGTHYLFRVSGVVSQEQASLTSSDFVKEYSRYIRALKQGIIPLHADYKAIFSSILTNTPEVIYAHPVGKERFLIKPIRPVIQFQAHHFFLSDIDGKYHPMVLSDASISWGLQISYPQIFQDPKSGQFSKVAVSADFPNSALFVTLSRWLRRNSLPTPFIYRGVKTNVPIRIGKQCLPWISSHPQLQARKLEVCVGS